MRILLVTETLTAGGADTLVMRLANALASDHSVMIAVLHGELPDGVLFAGFSPDPVEWIVRFDVALLPSEFPHDSLLTVVMEYLFCGKAVITTDVGEIGAMMRGPDGDIAGTLPDFDGDQISTDQLAAAMQAYVDYPALLLLHSERAGPAFEKFDMAVRAAAYAGLYRAVVAGPSNSSTSSSH